MFFCAFCDDQNAQKINFVGNFLCDECDLRATVDWMNNEEDQGSSLICVPGLVRALLMDRVVTLSLKS